MKTITIYFIALTICSTGAMAQWATSGSNIYNTNTGNVGIGTGASPISYKLHVKQASGSATMKLESDNGSAYMYIDRGLATSNSWLGFMTLGVDNWVIGPYGSGFTDDFRIIDWTTGGSGNQSFIIKRTTNNVGIGTNSPSSTLSVGANKFNVAGTDGDVTFSDPQASITFPAVSGASQSMIQMFASGTTNADRMVIAHSAGFPTYGLQYQDNTDKFNFLSAGNPVLTVDLGTSNVGIGTSSPTQKLHVLGNILSTGNITPSDIRLKENIKTLGYGLNEVMKLHPVSYNWRSEPNGKKVLGLIAQETLLVTPEIIEQPKEGSDYYGMNYIQLVPVLIKAIQEQQAIITSQKTDLTEMKAELAELRKMVMAMQPKGATASTATIGNE